jgi:hypothetical protein
LRPSSPGFEAVVEMLRKQKNLSSLWFEPGLSAERCRSLRSESLFFVVEPVRITSVVACAGLAILGAGHGTCAAMMLGGVPMLLVPQNAEQRMLARVMELHGVAEELVRHRCGSASPIVRFATGHKAQSEAVATRSGQYRQHSPMASILGQALSHASNRLLVPKQRVTATAHR